MAPRRSLNLPEENPVATAAPETVTKPADEKKEPLAKELPSTNGSVSANTTNVSPIDISKNTTQDQNGTKNKTCDDFVEPDSKLT